MNYIKLRSFIIRFDIFDLYNNMIKYLSLTICLIIISMPFLKIYNGYFFCCHALTYFGQIPSTSGHKKAQLNQSSNQFCVFTRGTVNKQQALRPKHFVTPWTSIFSSFYNALIALNWCSTELHYLSFINYTKYLFWVY